MDRGLLQRLKFSAYHASTTRTTLDLDVFTCQDHTHIGRGRNTGGVRYWKLMRLAKHTCAWGCGSGMTVSNRGRVRGRGVWGGEVVSGEATGANLRQG